MPAVVLSRNLRFLLLILTVLSGAFFIQVVCIYAPTLYWRDGMIFDGRGYALGVDFVNSWMMGYLAQHDPNPAQFYQLDAYYPQLQALFGSQYSQQLWSYPPHYVWMMMLFGSMAYLVALAVFLSLNLLVFLSALRARIGAGWKLLTLAIVVSPAALMSLISGQISFALLALQLSVFQQLDRRPILAGCLLGLLTVKPQLGLAYPFS